jgi:hypothetical protein
LVEIRQGGIREQYNTRAGFGIWDLGFGIWDSGFGIRDSGFGIRDSGFGIRDSGFGIRDFCFRVFPWFFSVFSVVILFPLSVVTLDPLFSRHNHGKTRK